MAVRKKEVNWAEYFASITGVCPWSKAYWAKQKIDVQRWRGETKITPLGDYVARMWLHPNASGRVLCNIHYRLNEDRPHEEWLFSHPQYRGHSETLNKARKGNKKNESKHSPQTPTS